MEYTIELSPAERVIVESTYSQNEERLRDRWGVQDLAGFLHLMVMHGADCFDSLPFSA